MSVRYIEENNQYSLDCSEAVWSTDKVHSCYQDAGHKYGEIGFLCDVDFVVEDKEYIYLVEYKNANIPNAANPSAFKPTSGNKLDHVARKYFDTIHFLYLLKKDKPKKYIYILEYPARNSTSRLMVRNKLQKKLPFALQSGIAKNDRKLIDEIRVVDISEWNSDDILGKYPLRPVNEKE